MTGAPLHIEMVVPVFNEAQSIDRTCERLLAVLDSCGRPGGAIFIDDGSVDDTWKKLKIWAEKDVRIKLIRFSRNFGHQSAITAGLDHSSADYNLILDGNLQDPPELLTPMLALADQGYQIVYGLRTDREGETAVKKTTAAIFYHVLNFFSDYAIPVAVGEFRLVSSQARRLFLQVKEKSRLSREIWAWMGLKQTAIEYERPKRTTGQSKYNWLKMIKLAWDGLTATGNGPLLILVFLFALLLVLSLLLAFFGIHLPAVLAFSSALIFAGLAVLGIYVGRLYRQTRKRPTYLISEILKK